MHQVRHLLYLYLKSYLFLLDTSSWALSEPTDSILLRFVEKPAPGSPEEKSLEIFRNPRDWLGIEKSHSTAAKGEREKPREASVGLDIAEDNSEATLFTPRGNSSEGHLNGALQ